MTRCSPLAPKKNIEERCFLLCVDNSLPFGLLLDNQILLQPFATLQRYLHFSDTPRCPRLLIEKAERLSGFKLIWQVSGTVQSQAKGPVQESDDSSKVLSRSVQSQAEGYVLDSADSSGSN